MFKKKREPLLEGIENGPHISAYINSKHLEARDTLCGKESQDCLACGQTSNKKSLLATTFGKFLTIN